MRSDAGFSTDLVGFVFQYGPQNVNLFVVQAGVTTTNATFAATLVDNTVYTAVFTVFGIKYFRWSTK